MLLDGLHSMSTNTLYAEQLSLPSSPVLSSMGELNVPIASIAQRNQQVQQLYRQNNSWLINWLCKKIGCPDNAADLAQDTFFRLLNVSNLTAIKEPRAFLTTTATRLVIDDARRKKVEKSYLQNCKYYHGDEHFYPSAEDLSLITEALTSIVKMLEALPEKCQKAFILNRLHGLGHGEIATQLGVSKSMIKKYMAQAMLHCYQVMYADTHY